VYVYVFSGANKRMIHISRQHYITDPDETCQLLHDLRYIFSSTHRNSQHSENRTNQYCLDLRCWWLTPTGHYDLPSCLRLASAFLNRFRMLARSSMCTANLIHRHQASDPSCGCTVSVWRYRTHCSQLLNSLTLTKLSELNRMTNDSYLVLFRKLLT